MDFNRQPELHGARVCLRPLILDDFDTLRVAASDPRIWDQHPEQRHEPATFRAYFDERIADRGALLITDARTGEVIGSSSFTGLDEAASEIEIGYTFLRRDHWGDGTNDDVKSIMLRHAFAQLENVIFMVAEQNLRSQAAVRKLGAREIEPRPSSSGLPYVTFRITRAEFEALQ